ncbi:dephospho-CoA kinase [Rhodococcus sp. Leaf7]|uniref:dephospho-CoA kinase n=1 Tax=unclassified Rhodococcus (in: high G+C Gram-positive bacteria) TaxID=192944 RepID=UPI0006FB606D|nr:MULTISPECIES: dephospho-CoA kinase [unclassified Rhodococcus (in: high G+C Gram-positive bacteria)]KQU07663.1 dephospho-CoA kinase [Rhodococcus sp. Leaf7]KQU43183.1 dephospho-CoA kinase [Rhodococcus sp. Leaf247]
MLRIGLTGGMGAGKSTVSRTLASLGAVVVDADKIAREVVEPGTPGLAALVERFGDDILAEDGTLLRPALAARAFGDEESRLALNGIMHPLIGRRTTELIESAPDDCVLVHDIPLLVESRSAAAFHLVVVVYLEAEERVRRLVASRGLDEKDARSRIAAQATDEQRRDAADVWLDNSGTQEALESAVHELWSNRLEPFARNVRSAAVARSAPAVVPADPTWPAQARRVADRIRLACGDKALRVDHIGSTAVPDFPAKDVLDIQVTVADLTTADALRESLTAATFPRIEHIVTDDPMPSAVPGEADPALWEKRLHGAADPGRPVNIHVRVDGWPGQVFALMFRDWLRADASAREEYLTVKERASTLAAQHDDYSAAIDAYVRAKAPYFEGVYPTVLSWATRTGWSAD